MGSSRRQRLAAMALVALGACAPGVASAQSGGPFGYPEGFALQPIYPSPAGDRFFGVADASSYPDEKLRLIALADWAFAPTLRREQPDAAGTVQTVNLVASSLYVHAGLAYPLTDWLHAHVDVPFLATQSTDVSGGPTGAALSDPRIGVRANFLEPTRAALALGPGLDVWVPVGDADKLAGDGSVRGRLHFGASGRAGSFVYAADLGYLFRKELQLTPLQIGDAGTFGLAAGLRLFDGVLQVGPELTGQGLVAAGVTARETVAASGFLGARVRVGDVVFGAAVGTGLSSYPGVGPRALLSVALAPEPEYDDDFHATDDEDADGDGVLDSADACPKEAGPRTDEPTTSGCPAEKTASAQDRDADGVADEDDRCPDEAGDDTGASETRGCPGGPGPGGSDLDGDGITDDADACPRLAGQPAARADKNGCPPQATPGPATAAAGPPLVTYAGQHLFADGSSRIYVRLTRPVSVSEQRQGARVSYVMAGAEVPEGNNRKDLPMEHFASPVMVARLQPTAGGAALQVELRSEVKPQHRLLTHGDGSATLVVDFPARAKQWPARAK